MQTYQIGIYKMIIEFYKKFKYSKFKSLTNKRCQELDDIVSKWWNYFHYKHEFLEIANFIAKKLTTSYKNFGLKNGDEIFYFYIKMLDPSLILLEIHECANTIEEFNYLVETNLHFFDKYLLTLEKTLNDTLQIYSSIDLWSREAIRNNHLINIASPNEKKR